MGIFEIYGQQKTLTQWDMGRKMVVHDACTQVHYANAAMAEAIVCQVSQEDGQRVARIPDEVLQSSGTLWVYAYLADGEGYTKHTQTFFVKARPKPTDYVYTPTEWVTVEQILERMNTLEKREEREETDPTVPLWAKNATKPAYSAAEVGAAPAGYGLGTDLTDTQPFTTIAEIDGFRVNGARRIMLSTEHIEGTQYGTLVCSAGDRYAEQRLFSHYAQYGGFYEKKRVWTNSLGWQPWEWVNPAMRASGKEYRTTERISGKPVYVKVIDMGAMPNASIKEVAHGIQNIGFVVDVRVFARDDASNLLYAPSTAGADTTLTAAVGVSKTTVWVNTNTNRSAMSGYALLKYTKTTD